MEGGMQGFITVVIGGISVIVLFYAALRWSGGVGQVAKNFGPNVVGPVASSFTSQGAL